MDDVIKRGDIHIAETDLIRGEVRPVLVISNTDLINSDPSAILVLPIRSIEKNDKVPYYLKIDRLKYGFDRDSYVDLRRIYTIDFSQIKHKVSELSADDLLKVNNVLMEYLGLVQIEKADIPVYKDFIIKTSANNMNIFLDHLQEEINKKNGWQIEENQEVKNLYFIRKTERTKTEPSTLFLKVESDGMEITNIVPIYKSSLTINEYNQILDEFESIFVKNAPIKFEVIYSPETVNLDEILHSDALHALKVFSYAANKLTGSVHPLDKERWNVFVSTSFKRNCILQSTLLKRWLIEVEKWPDDVAIQLSIQYEDGISLLKAYVSE